MSRSQPSLQPYEDDQDQPSKYWIGYHMPELEYSYSTEMHWSERLAMGYKPTAWPKRDNDCDDDRFNLLEKETE